MNVRGVLKRVNSNATCMESGAGRAGLEWAV